MLTELVHYARLKALDVEASFRPKDIKWLLLFKPDGTFIDVAPLGTEKRGLTVAKCPHLQFSGDTPMRQFLVDTAEYLALLGANAADAKLHRKHAYVIDLLVQAGAVVPELAMVAKSMGRTETMTAIGAALMRVKAKPADNLTLGIVQGGVTRNLVEERVWHDWWRSHWPTLFAKRQVSAEAGRSRCLVSGEPCEPVLTHPKVRGLGDVGGKVETALVSFNLPAFCSYGLDQSANAAVGADAANAYVGALNELIETTGQRLGGVKVVHWYAGHDDRPVAINAEQDPLCQVESIEGLFEPMPATASALRKRAKRVPDADAGRRATEAEAQRRARDFLRSVKSGERPDLAAYRYFALTLSGSSARVMLRGFVTGRFGDLCAAVDAWFSDLEIVYRNGDGLAPVPKFGAILAAMVRDLKDIAAPVAAKLWRCAIQKDEPIPESFAAQALSRAVINFVNGDAVPHARIGLLRAYLARKGDQSVTPFLNEDHPDPAYHCGRLLAVLDDIQYAAVGDVGAGIVQRYYAAASATPALVLGRLVRLANTGHLPKVDYDRRQRLEQRLAAVWGRLQQDPPSTLSLAQQTLFAMGYYQQKASRA